MFVILWCHCVSTVEPTSNNTREKLIKYMSAIMPAFNESTVDPQPHGRYKRFVSILTRILFDGVNALINHIKHLALQKGMMTLLTKQKINEGTITALGTQMVSIAQTTLKEIERLQKDIADNNKRLKRLSQCVM